VYTLLSIYTPKQAMVFPAMFAKRWKKNVEWMMKRPDSGRAAFKY
jgi:hypothetical protein